MIKVIRKDENKTEIVLTNGYQTTKAVLNKEQVAALIKALLLVIIIFTNVLSLQAQNLDSCACKFKFIQSQEYINSLPNLFVVDSTLSVNYVLMRKFYKLLNKNCDYLKEYTCIVLYNEQLFKRRNILKIEKNERNK